MNLPMLKDFLNSTVKLLLIITTFIVLLILNWRIWKKDFKQEETILGLQKQLVIQENENIEMNATNTELRTRIDSLKRGSLEMIEEEARDNFGMVGEGETYYELKKQ